MTKELSPAENALREAARDYHRSPTRGKISVTPSKPLSNQRDPDKLVGIIAALMLKLGDADAMLCGLLGRFDVHLEHVRDVIGVKPGASGFATLNALMLEKHTLFIADTFVNEDPDAAQLASIALMATDEVRRFGLPPKVAFLSHSMYGSSNRKSAVKMRLAHELFCQIAPDVECDGELHGDVALSQDVRHAALMDSKLRGEANLLICPNLDAVGSK